MGCGARSWTSRSTNAPQPIPSRHNPTTAGVTAVNAPTYDKSISALLVVDPYNDFISEGGKIWPRIKAVAEANDCVSNMLKVLNAARAVKLRVFYAMHHRYRAGDYETWTYIAPIQRGTWQHKSFEYGTWGGEFRAEFVPAPGEIVAQEHCVPVASPIPTWTCSSRSTASISSSSSDSSRIPASKRLCAMPPSSVMTSPSLRMRRRTTQTR